MGYIAFVLLAIGLGVLAWKYRTYLITRCTAILGHAPKISTLPVLLVGIPVVAIELWLVFAVLGNPFANPVAFGGAAVMLGIVNYGLYLIYKAGGGKVAMWLAYAALTLGVIIGIAAIFGGTDLANRLTGRMQSGVTGLVDLVVGDRGERQARTTTAAPSAPAVPAGVPTSIVVPACGNGWSKVIQIPAYWNITSAWSMDTVQAAWRENGEWKQFPGKYLSGSFDAVKYCAKNSSYAGEAMLLTWTQR